MIQQVFDSESIPKATVLIWHNCFKGDWDCVGDKPRGRCLSTNRNKDNTQCMHDLLNWEWRLNVRIITDQVRIDKITMHAIITEDLKMRKICAKFVSKELTASWPRTAWHRATLQRLPIILNLYVNYLCVKDLFSPLGMSMLDT